MIYFQFQKEFREYHRDTFVLDGKFYDRRIEEVNRAQKSLLPAGQVTQAKVEDSALMIQLAKIMASVSLNSVFSESSSTALPFLKDKKCYIDLIPELVLMLKLFNTNKVWHKVPGRQEVYRLDDPRKEVKKGATMADLNDYGLGHMAINIPEIIAEKYPTHPPSVSVEDETEEEGGPG